MQYNPGPLEANPRDRRHLVRAAERRRPTISSSSAYARSFFIGVPLTLNPPCDPDTREVPICALAIAHAIGVNPDGWIIHVRSNHGRSSLSHTIGV
jgi:hypothetical protein